MKRYLKYVAAVLLLFSLIPVTRDRLFAKRIGIKAADGTKFYVPDAIVKSKDCETFREWRDALTRPGFVPTNSACPWELKKEGVGEFTLNGVELRIPREYLWLGGDQPDGVVKDKELHIMLGYPSLKPASADGDQTHHIEITLKGNGPKAYLSWYHVLTGTISDKQPAKLKPSIFISHVESLDMDYYKLPSESYNQDVFIKGTREEPEDWIVCEHNYNSRCQTSFEINQSLSVVASFREFPNLEKYRELKPNIISLIQTFIAK